MAKPIQYPTEGGSYTRKPDGALDQVVPPPKPAEPPKVEETPAAPAAPATPKES